MESEEPFESLVTLVKAQIHAYLSSTSEIHHLLLASLLVGLFMSENLTGPSFLLKESSKKEKLLDIDKQKE